MDNSSDRLLRSCLTMLIVVGISLGVLIMIGIIVFGTQLAGL